MKVSLKFREDQKPLIKAKVPISIFGLPFLSGVSAGDTKELCVDLVTAFEAGPALRTSYRPNDPASPFALSLRTGVGCFGSPFGAPMSMTAEFNFGGSPNFVVLFKPRLGDFSFKKVTASTTKVTAPQVEPHGDPSAVWVEKVNGTKGGPAVGPLWGIGELLNGLEVTARSVLPLRSKAAVRFKWGVRVPAEIRTAFAEDGNGGGISFSKLPLLVMNKISIVHVAEDKKHMEKKKKKEDELSKGIDDVAAVKKQLEAIREENGALRKALEELRERVPVGVVTDVSMGGARRPVAVEGIRKLPEGSGRSAEAAAKGEAAGGGK